MCKLGVQTPLFNPSSSRRLHCGMTFGELLPEWGQRGRPQLNPRKAPLPCGRETHPPWESAQRTRGRAHLPFAGSSSQPPGPSSPKESSGFRGPSDSRRGRAAVPSRRGAEAGWASCPRQNSAGKEGRARSSRAPSSVQVGVRSSCLPPVGLVAP